MVEEGHQLWHKHCQSGKEMRELLIRSIPYLVAAALVAAIISLR